MNGGSRTNGKPRTKARKAIGKEQENEQATRENQKSVNDISGVNYHLGHGRRRVGSTGVGPNGHLYEVVIDPGIFAADADAAASGSQQFGVSGHLATLTSSDEDSFVEGIRAAVVASLDPILTSWGVRQEFWVGGSQADDSNDIDEGWQWANGEGDIIIGVTYTNWLAGEPSDGWIGAPETMPGVETNAENYLAIGLQGNVGWNDERDGAAGGNTLGYVVEYDTPTSEAVLFLADEVVQLNVQQGILNSLDAKLNAVFNTVDDISTDNDVAAINSLSAFIVAVDTQLANGKIPAEDAPLAQALIDNALTIVDLLAQPVE